MVSGIGQEAISVGTARALNSGGIHLTMHRNLGVFTSRGISIEQIVCTVSGLR